MLLDLSSSWYSIDHGFTLQLCNDWSSLTWDLHVDMIFKIKQRLTQICHLSAYLEPADLPIIYKSFVWLCLEYMVIFFALVLVKVT